MAVLLSVILLRRRIQDGRALALGMWVSQLQRRHGDTESFQTMLLAAIASREAARKAAAPSLLAAYIETPECRLTEKKLRRGPRSTGGTLHLPHFAKADPRHLTLSHRIQSSNVQRDSLDRLILAVTEIGNERTTAVIPDLTIPSKSNWRTEAAAWGDATVILINRPPIYRWFNWSWWYSSNEDMISAQFSKNILDMLKLSSSMKILLSQLHQSPKAARSASFRPNDLLTDISIQPEHAALILLDYIRRSLSRCDVVAVSEAISICIKLALDAQFSAALENILVIWIHENTFEIDIWTLRLFLYATGWQWAKKDPEEYNYLQSLGQKSWACRQIGEQIDHASENSGYWVVSGEVPFGWLGKISAKKLTLVSFGKTSLSSLQTDQINRLRQPGTTTLEIGLNAVLPPYSLGEDALSQRTARLARLMTAAFTEIIGPEQAQGWFHTLDLVVDDLLFATTREFWSLLQHLCQHSATSKGVFCESPDLTEAFAASLEWLGPTGQVQLIEPVENMGHMGDGESLSTRLFTLLISNSAPLDPSELRRSVQSILSETTVSPGTSGAAILIGRRYDRNYKTDLSALGKVIQNKSRRVIFMPTAIGGMKKNIAVTLNKEKSDWYGEAYTQPANSLWVAPPIARAFRKQGMFYGLINHIYKSGVLDPIDLSILLVSKKQLEKFYAEKFLRYVKVGTMVTRYIGATKPAYIALLPGRDFIARVAAISARENNIPSFDVQTVFVGARSRYKPTLADIQLTIETESKRLFQSYFELLPEQIILAGCAKVGVVHQQGKRLDRDSVRHLAMLGDRFHLVFAGSPFLIEDKPILDAIVAGLGRWPDVCLGIRLHPTADQSFATYCAKLANEHSNVSVLTQLNLPQTIISADILITRFSNVGLEAGLLDRDVIACNFTQEPAPIRLDMMGVATAVIQDSDLLTCIDDFRAHGTRWQALQQTRQQYRKRNPQLFVASAAEHIHHLMEQFVNDRLTQLQ